MNDSRSLDKTDSEDLQLVERLHIAQQKKQNK